ncbi:stage III sporulation protein AF [Moorella sulfitireducens (nom. illeg.)]|uniref:stage III sporulation protein AF n=1 Tax=Neomoorella sulfitireducens TaxID=2972948 RepID=UPI0021AC1EE4|nr:stage III sporulation protein AF [Moorella sulfitireducens]
MLAKIGEIVRQVALIALLAAFLEMLLPDKKITRYVRLVLGLFVVVAILTPLAEGLRFGPELELAAWDLRLDPAAATPVQQGRDLARANEEAALEIYRERLAGQIRALVTLVPGVKQAEVLVDLSGDKERPGAIRRVVVTATLESEEPVKGSPDASPVPPGNLPGTQGAVTPETQFPGRPEQITEQEKGQPAIAPQITPAEVEEIQSRIVTMITHFYGLASEQVDVRILEVRGGRSEVGEEIR